MATGKHIGKVLLKIREEDKVYRSPPNDLVDAIPRTYMSNEKSYILLGKIINQYTSFKLLRIAN